MSFQEAQNVTILDSVTFNNVGRDKLVFDYTYKDSDFTDPLVQLMPVPDAMGYSSIGIVSGCMEGTRGDVLHRIVEWLDKDDRSMCWLHGAAGSGKSAISRTIAERYAGSGRLAGSFFFLRGSSIVHFISTLAYQLAISFPSTRPYIENIIQNDSSILDRSLEHQFQKLIVEPVRSVQGLSQPILFVIDALDECVDEAIIADFIGIVASTPQTHPPLRFFFSSRMEEHIRREFSTSPALPATFVLSLHSFDADNDIRVFFRSRFSMIYAENRRLMPNISLPWPSESDLDQLVRKSNGSFIFAFTVVNYINAGSDLPHRKLQACLQSHAGLDPLYIQVLSSAPRSPHFIHIFETIMTITEPLSIIDLACLLQMEAGDVIHALLGVQSIMIVPESADEHVRPFHTSLRDFLFTKARSYGYGLYINPATRHLSITIDCLTAMMAYSGDEFLECGGLQYACRKWSNHLLCAIQESDGDNPLYLQDGVVNIEIQLENFVSWSLDPWINCLTRLSRSLDPWIDSQTSLSQSLHPGVNPRIRSEHIDNTLRTLDFLLSTLAASPGWPPRMLVLIKEIKVSVELGHGRHKTPIARKATSARVPQVRSIGHEIFKDCGDLPPRPVKVPCTEETERPTLVAVADRTVVDFTVPKSPVSPKASANVKRRDRPCCVFQ